MTGPKMPSLDDIYKATLVVVAKWCKKPAGELEVGDKLEELRPGKSRALGLALMAYFEDKYAPIFAEERFDKIWSYGSISTVQHCYYAAILSFAGDEA